MPKSTETPRDAALALLVNRGVPVPSEWAPDFPLPSLLFFLNELARETLKQAVVFFGDMDRDGDEVDDVAGDTMNQVTHCLASSTVALVSLGLLPQEAEDAMVEAAK